MRVIFLDVDGVLNSRPQIDHDYLFRKDKNDISYHLHDYYVKNLSRLYHKYPDTKIVLTSTWKQLLSHDRGKMLISKLKEFDMEIFDSSPDYYHTNGELIPSRPEEINDWLATHPGVKYWVSLDDDYSIKDYEMTHKDFGLHLVKTKFCGDSMKACGFNNLKLHVALEILGGELN